jgi:hypothetical protein
MANPFDLDTTDPSASLLFPTESEVAGLLRRAARDLARLEQQPARPGRVPHLSAASQAVRDALGELEPGSPVGPGRGS